MPHEMAEDRYDVTTEEGYGQNALETYGERTVEDKAGIPIAGSESGVWQFWAPHPETSDIGESNPGRVCAIGKKMATNHKEPVAMEESISRKVYYTHLPTVAPETMAVGPECPPESLEEEGSDNRSRIVEATIRRRNEQKPLDPIPENSAFGTLRPHETEEMDDDTEESWHDANQDGM